MFRELVNEEVLDDRLVVVDDGIWLVVELGLVREDDDEL